MAWIKASRVGGSDRISAFPRVLKICYLAVSTDDDITDSVTNNETTNDSITFKFSSVSVNVGRLLYSRNILETTKFFSHASSKFHFSDVIKASSIITTWKRVHKQQLFVPQSYICSSSIHKYATSVKSKSRHDGDSQIAINFQEIRHIRNQNCNNIRIICSHVNIF